MKMKKSIIALSLVASALFVGCSDDSSDSTTTTPTTSSTETGTFVDAPVQGLHYTTATQDGYTDENGDFKYLAGETVEFKLGNLSLGTVNGGGLVSPYTIAGVANGVDNNISTNIALLLQNLDGDRSDSATLDLSKLKDFNFTDINLSDTPLAMETTLSNQLTAGDFDNFVNPNDKTVLSADTVNSAMKTYVESESETKNDVSNIIGTTFDIIDCGELLGCTSQATIALTDTKMSVVYDGENFSGTYEKLESGVLKIIWSDDNSIEYMKILDISDNVVSICAENDTEAEALACTKGDDLVTSDIKDSFIATKNALNPDMPTNKTLVTDFSELQNNQLFHINSWAVNNGMTKQGILITDDGSILWKHSDELNSTLNDSDFGAWGNGISHYTAEFINNKLHVLGKDGEEDYDETTSIYKYNLADAKITIQKEDDNPIIYDNDNIPSDYKKVYSFTKGNMYCGVLWSECWFDQDAVSEIASQQN